METVVVVVPTFRPDAASLLALCGTLAGAGLRTVVSDDASPCTTDAVLRDLEAAGVTVARHRRNRGIARGLNDGLRLATAAGASWLLTVDQDSSLSSDYVLRMLAAADEAGGILGPDAVGAIAAGVIDDESGALGYPTTLVGPIHTTHEVIQTGTLWSVAGLTAIGGFDEALGIDAVDAAACVRLRRTGRSIAVVPGLRIGHRIGAGRQVNLLGRTVLASGHGPERRTTMVRNRLALFPAEFSQSPTHALRTLRRLAVNTALAVTVEDDRWAKAKASARGLLPAHDR